jgi:hypothetical protein
MMLDDELPRHKHPQTFPRKPDGMSVEQMREYIAELEAEAAKFQKEIDSRGGVKAKADALFK